MNLENHNFDSEGRKKCDRDYLEIDEGTKYCGQFKTSFSIISAGSTMMVKFVSDGSVTKQGFSATWTYTDEKPISVEVLEIQEITLQKNRDSILNVKAKIALVISLFKHSIKTPQTPLYQTRLPATNCQEFLTLVTERNNTMKSNFSISIIKYLF